MRFVFPKTKILEVSEDGTMITSVKDVTNKGKYTDYKKADFTQADIYAWYRKAYPDHKIKRQQFSKILDIANEMVADKVLEGDIIILPIINFEFAVIETNRPLKVDEKGNLLNRHNFYEYRKKLREGEEKPTMTYFTDDKQFKLRSTNRCCSIPCGYMYHISFSKTYRRKMGQYLMNRPELKMVYKLNSEEFKYNRIIEKKQAMLIEDKKYY